MFEVVLRCFGSVIITYHNKTGDSWTVADAYPERCKKDREGTDPGREEGHGKKFLDVTTQSKTSCWSTETTATDHLPKSSLHKLATQYSVPPANGTAAPSDAATNSPDPLTNRTPTSIGAELEQQPRCQQSSTVVDPFNRS